MEKEFVPYKLALRMKALDFDEPCLGVYYTKDGDIRKCSYDEIGDAPTFSQAFRWFREKYGLSGWVDESFGGGLRRGVISIKSEIGSKYYPTTTKLFYTYEEAELDCLEKLIEIVEQKTEVI